jgi:UTP:GlnB (protein PII) uridylyltransferase
MSQDNQDNTQELSAVLIHSKKLLQFQQWCNKNQVDAQVIIEKIIDACLRDDEIFTSFLLAENNSPSLSNQIQLYLDKSLQQLIKRIEKLEAQINQSPETISSAKISPQVQVKKKPEPKKITGNSVISGKP